MRTARDGAAVSDDPLVRELLLGFIRIHILHHTAEGPVYGSEFHDELARHGYRVSYGTLYPIFHRMEKDGYIASEKRTVNGKVRRYYDISEKGRAALAEAREKAGELYREISPGFAPARRRRG